MTKWFIEYTIIQDNLTGFEERDGEEFFYTTANKIGLEEIESMLTNISLNEGCAIGDVLIDNIAKINGN